MDIVSGHFTTYVYYFNMIYPIEHNNNYE